MHVLFLALGANRRRAVREEARRVIDDGGRAVVLVTGHSAWADEPWPAGVRVVRVPDTGTHWPLRAEKALLYKVPRRLLAGAAKVARRDPKRWAKAYEKRAADRLHRKVFLPAYRKAWPNRPKEALVTAVRGQGPYDAFVVTDPASFPVAHELIGSERVAFRIDQLLTPADLSQPTDRKGRV